MKNVRRSFVALMLITIFAAVPMFAGSGGSGQDNNGCKACYAATYQPSPGQTVTNVWCGAPGDGEGGHEECNIECFNFGGSGWCSCQPQGDWCLYIVVQG
jgi:hypothetical protein